MDYDEVDVKLVADALADPVLFYPGCYQCIKLHFIKLKYPVTFCYEAQSYFRHMVDAHHLELKEIAP